MLKKINELLDNNIEKILIIFLCIQPIINLVTSLSIKFYGSNFTIGIVIRGIILLVFAYYSLFLTKFKYKKILNTYIILIFIYFLIYIRNIFIFKDVSVMSIEIKYLIKAFFFPLMLLFSYIIFNYKKINIKYTHFVTSTFIYILILLIADLTNTAFTSYGGYKEGNVGWFYAANEIGSIIAIIFPIILFWVIEKKGKLHYFIFSLIYVIVAMRMGTKVPFVGILLSLVVMGVFYFFHYIITKRKENIYVLSIPIIATFLFILFILPYTPAGKNLNMHFKLVNVNSIADFFYPNREEKIDDLDDNLSEVRDPLNVVFSSRDKYFKETKKSYLQAPMWLKLTGIGLIENYGSDNERVKSIEMDFHDIFFRLGYLGFIIYFSFPLILIFNIMRNNIINIKRCTINIKLVCYFLSVVLGLSIAYVAGHILTAPAVSIYLVYIMIILEKELKVNTIKEATINEENMD